MLISVAIINSAIIKNIILSFSSEFFQEVNSFCGKSVPDISSIFVVIIIRIFVIILVVFFIIIFALKRNAKCFIIISFSISSKCIVFFIFIIIGRRNRPARIRNKRIGNRKGVNLSRLFGLFLIPFV